MPEKKPMSKPTAIILACSIVGFVAIPSLYFPYADRQKREEYEKRQEERQAKAEARRQAKAAESAQSSANSVAAARASMLEVSAASMGDKWPLTVDKGVLRCDTRGAIFIYVIGQGKFGVNSIADATKDFQDIRPIWRANPDPKMAKLGLKVDITSLKAEGQKLCGPK
jgi:hypothetical protein